MAGNNDQIWPESKANEGVQDPEKIRPEAEAVLKTGKPALRSHILFVPLVVKNHTIGIACFLKAEDKDWLRVDDYRDKPIEP